MAGGGVAFSQALENQGNTNSSEPVIRYGTGGRITGFATGGQIGHSGIRHFDIGGDTTLGTINNSDLGANDWYDVGGDFGGGYDFGGGTDFGGTDSRVPNFSPDDPDLPEIIIPADRPVGEITPFDFGPDDDILIPVNDSRVPNFSPDDPNLPEIIIPADRPPREISPFDFGPDDILIPVTYDPAPDDDNVPEMIIPAPRPPGPEPEDIIPIPFTPIPEPIWEPWPEPGPEPVPEPGPEPVPVPEPGPTPEPVPVPEPGPTPEPFGPTPDPAPEPVPTPEPVPVPEPGPIYDPVPEPIFIPTPVPWYAPTPVYRPPVVAPDPAPAPYIPPPGPVSRAGIYRPQYQNYANPLTMFNVSNYGQDVPTSPGYNYAASHQGITALNQNLRDMAAKQMAQTYPDGSPRGADMNQVLAEMRKVGVTATDLENAYYGRMTGLNTPFSVYSKTPPMQTPFSFTDVQQPQQPQTPQQKQVAMSNGIFDLVKKLPK